MLDVFIERGMHRLRSGQMKVSGRDLVGALRQQLEAGSQPGTEKWQQFTLVLLDGARRQLGAKGFETFRSEVALQIRV